MWRRRPRLLDLLPPAALVVLGVVDIAFAPADFPGNRAAHGLALVATSVPLAWRRHAPLGVLAVVACGVVAWIYGLYGLEGQPPIEPFLALTLASYGAAARTAGPQAWAALAVIGAVIVGEEVPALVAGRPIGSVFPACLFWLLAYGVGRVAYRGWFRAVELERAQDRVAQEAIDAERRRIARDLHDVVAHAISVIVVQAAAERRVLSDRNGQTAAVLLGIEHTGRQALDELRRLLGILRTSDGPSSLEPQPDLSQLDRLLSNVRDAGLQVAVVVEGDPTPLSAGIGLAAYRVIQEALTNVLKHAGDPRAIVTVRFGARELDIEVLDEGRGPRSSSQGHGLIGMRERVALYGGALDAGGRAGGGYRLHVRLPITGSLR